jgi:hypothetical protein
LVSGQGELVSELAGYAEQTAEIEDTIETLTAMEEDQQQDDQFARLAYGTPSEQALYALVRAVNPAASGFNPLGAGRRVGPTTTKGRAVNAFFENAGDFVPGGGALPLLKGWLFPDNEFRSVYAQTTGADGIALCAQRQFVKTRNRIVYLWAYRVLNEPAPPVALAAPVSIPIGRRAPVPVRTRTTMEWRLLDRIREWYLVNASGTRVRVPARPGLRPNLEVDLRNSSLPAGDYRMEGAWDWDTVRVDGQARLDPLGDLQRVRPTAASAARLVEASGLVEVDLEGADFQFVERPRCGARARSVSSP